MAAMRAFRPRRAKAGSVRLEADDDIVVTAPPPPKVAEVITLSSDDEDAQTAGHTHEHIVSSPAAVPAAEPAAAAAAAAAAAVIKQEQDGGWTAEFQSLRALPCDRAEYDRLHDLFFTEYNVCAGARESLTRSQRRTARDAARYRQDREDCRVVAAARHGRDNAYER